MALPEPNHQPISPSPAHGAVGIQGSHGRSAGGWGVGDTSAGDDIGGAVPLPVVREPGAGTEVSSQVAARLLAEILALDLGNLTPIRALTLLYELQTAAREAVPWNDWMANLAGAPVHLPPADKKTP